MVFNLCFKVSSSLAEFRLFFSFVEAQSVSYAVLSESRLVALQAPVYVVLAQVQRVPGVAANIALLAFIIRLHLEFPSFECWAALCAFSLDVKKLIVIDHA